MPKTPDSPSDADLVRAVRAGDRQAYGRLVDRHLAQVYAVAVRIVGNTADAEDLAQDAFLRAFERLHLYDMNHPFRNWLAKIAANLAVNHLRARHRERLLHLRLAEGGPDSLGRSGPASETPSPSEWRYWLDQLDASQRAAIVLFHFHEMPYAEIAEVLDVPLNTVRTLLHRGRKRLRELTTTRLVAENGSWNVVIQSG